MFLADFSSLTFRFGSYLEDGLQASLSLIGFGLSSSAPERYSAKPEQEDRRCDEGALTEGRAGEAARGRATIDQNANGEWRRQAPIKKWPIDEAPRGAMCWAESNLWNF